MLRLLLVCNGFLAVLTVIAAWGRGVRRGVEGAGRIEPRSLDQILDGARSADPRVAATAFAACAREPERATPALVSVISAVDAAPVEAGPAAVWAIRTIVARSPHLLLLVWPATSPAARRAIIRATTDAAAGLTDKEEDAEPARRVLRAAMTDPDERVRRAACGALARFHRHEALPLAVAALADSDGELRRLAFDWVGQHAPASIIATLLDRAVLNDAGDASLPIRALAQIGAREPAALVTAVRTDPDVNRRVVAIRALGMAGAVGALDLLATLLAGESRAVRRAAAQAVAEIASIAPRAIGPDVLVIIGSRFGREASVSVLIALLDIVDACRANRLLAIVDAHMPAMNPTVRARAEEVIARLAGAPATTQTDAVAGGALA